MRPIQYFSDEYLKVSQKMTTREIFDFLENFQHLVAKNKTNFVKDKSILISLKVPENLLNDFKGRCERSGLKYQSQIKKLMVEWLRNRE